MADQPEKVETTTVETADEKKEAVEGEEKVESSKEEGDKGDLDPDKYTPEERQRPWKNRQERAEFFKGKTEKEAAPEEKEEAVEEEGTDLSELPKIVEREVQKALSPFQQRLVDQQDDQEVKDFLGTSNNRERFGKYEPLVRKAMKVYSNVPVGNLFKQFAFDDAEKLGAEKMQKAQEKGTRRSITGTTTRKADSGIPDFRTMTPAQLEAFNREISRGKSIKVNDE